MRMTIKNALLTMTAVLAIGGAVPLHANTGSCAVACLGGEACTTAQGYSGICSAPPNCNCNQCTTVSGGGACVSPGALCDFAGHQSTCRLSSGGVNCECTPISSVPTMSEWAAMVMAGLLAIIGLYTTRR